MASKQTRKPTEAEVADYKKAFSYFDIDGNGSITVSELKQVLIGLGEDPTDQEITDMISDVDEDRNGTIEFPEFLVMMARQLREVDENEELKKAFNVMDIDHDGFITKSELSEAMKILGHNLTEEEVETMIKDADKNGDNKVDFDEFVAIMKQMAEMASSERIKELAEMFKNFDKDGDGKITFDELKEELRNIGDFKSDKEILQMIREVDLDKNGTIEFNEFAIYFDKQIGDMQTRREEMKITFNTFDINGDGFITFEELKTVFSSLGEEMDVENMKHMIQKVDLNHDGKLDFCEFTKLWRFLHSD
eukprot:TRINITY_DN78_c2_g1_i1.p1 TRINITY_DN78_c2_g1~~TRINITY_DN78_c2_g1_i1.p1  ORF type:complete len:322 (-),score=75.71 TRINITY_DN78_c2_g1_i1:941-1858(-)